MSPCKIKNPIPSLPKVVKLSLRLNDLRPKESNSRDLHKNDKQKANGDIYGTEGITYQNISIIIYTLSYFIQ